MLVRDSFQVSKSGRFYSVSIPCNVTEEENVVGWSVSSAKVS